MAKTKSARLSLTLPSSLHLPGSQALSPTSSTTFDMASPGTGRRKQGLVIESTGYERDTTPRTQAKPHSASPTKELAASYVTSPSTLSPTSPLSPTFTSLPPFPSSPGMMSKHTRDPSRSFFANLKASKSSSKIQHPEATIRKVSQDSIEESTAKVNEYFLADESTHFVPTEALSLRQEQQASVSAPSSENTTFPRPLERMRSSGRGTGNDTADLETKRKEGFMLSSIMRRNHGNRYDDAGFQSNPSTPTRSRAPGHDSNLAPRTRSANRNPSPHSDSGVSDYRSGQTFSGPQLNNQRSQIFRNGGANLFNGIKQRTVKAAGGLNNRLFKARDATKVDEPPPNYEYSVITLPLVEQTRITRIAKRLEDSKDKTEFWMPALPWRCIDYLNFNGTESEGLYRIPGSDLQIRYWKWKFDTEYDCDLFKADDLYDVNVVGSLFKAWLRDLPDEIFPKSTQEEITQQAKGSDTAPEILKEHLSQLPPWNYYLLFAITCHLSLLHACSDKTRMTCDNLYVCFGRSLKMNETCFRWLVTDWRNCWQGCFTERAYLDDEYRTLDHMESGSHSEMPRTPLGLNEDRSLSSSGSATNSHRPPALELTQKETDYHESAVERSQPTENASQLPELSLPQPISPFYNTEHTH